MNMQEKKDAIQRLQDALREYLSSSDKGNSYPIRFHRLYLDGSYGDIRGTGGGAALYELHLNRYKSRTLKEETFKKEALGTFKSFVVIEFFNREYLSSITEIEFILKDTLQKEYDKFINMLVNNIKEI